MHNNVDENYAATVLQHSAASSSYNPLLISFVGDSGVLASATVDGNTVDIWDPPSTDSDKVVMKTKSSILVDNENIIRYIIKNSQYYGLLVDLLDTYALCVISLTASKEPNESWIVVVTKTHGHIKASILDWKSSLPYRNFEIGEDHEISNIFAHLNGM